MADDNDELMKHGIECLSGIELVKRRPSMYWGTDSPTVEDALKGIMEELQILNCKNVRSARHADWDIIGASDDWVVSGLEMAGTVDRLFQEGMGFPQAKGTSLRFEFFLYVFAKDIVLWRNGESIIIKGSSEPKLLDCFRDYFYNDVAVAFKGNTYL